MLKIIFILLFISFAIFDFIIVCGPSLIKLLKESSKQNSNISEIDNLKIK